MNLENKILSDITGTPCPVCGVERVYKTLQSSLKGQAKPCRSCANSIKGGGQGDVKKRGCFECGEQIIYANSLCLTCHSRRSKQYYKETWRWSRYGLDGPIEMKCCEICEAEDDLVIDHCHGTKQFRGVLCRTCNVGIGLLKDDLKTISKAYDYAKRTFHE